MHSLISSFSFNFASGVWYLCCFFLRVSSAFHHATDAFDASADEGDPPTIDDTNDELPT